MRLLVDRIKNAPCPDFTRFIDKVNIGAVYDIVECVNALDKYEHLPKATKDSLIAISEITGFRFTFVEKRNRLILTGMEHDCFAMFLHPDDSTAMAKQRKLMCNAKEYQTVDDGKLEYLGTLDKYGNHKED